MPEKMPERETVVILQEKLDEGYIFRDCSEGCPLKCLDDPRAIIDNGGSLLRPDSKKKTLDASTPERETAFNCFTCPKVLLPPGSVVVPAALLDRVESEYEAFIGWILIEVNMGLSEGRKRTTRQALKAIQGRIKFPDCTQLAEARTALAALKAE